MANDKLGYFSVFGFLGRYLYFGRCCVIPISFLYRFYREGKGKVRGEKFSKNIGDVNNIL